MQAQSDDTLSSLNVSIPGSISGRRADELLGPDAEAWLDERLDEKRDGTLEFATSLSLRVSDRVSRVQFSKAAIVELGPVRRDGRDRSVDISWHASNLAPLFPVFAGTLTIDTQGLRLKGHYAPPGGGVGRLADKAILYIAAQKTAATLLEKLREAAR